MKTHSSPTLGNFSVSLAVKDVEKSLAFYEKLGFSRFAGDVTKRFVILRNGSAVLGLFQGVFEKNTLTFNPGWDAECAALESFTDVRELQAALAKAGIEPVAKADPSSKGPAHFVLVDPDGNPVLVDQHV